MTTGKRIHDLRKMNKMTQEELAKKIGVATQTVYKYEKGIVKNIPLETITKIANALNTTEEYLCCFDNIYQQNDEKNEPTTNSWLDSEIIHNLAKLDVMEREKAISYIQALLDSHKS